MGTSDNNLETLRDIYFRKPGYLRFYAYIIVPSLDRFGGHWRPTGDKVKNSTMRVWKTDPFVLNEIYKDTLYFVDGLFTKLKLGVCASVEIIFDTVQ